MLQSLIRGSNKFYCCTIKIPQPPPPPPNKKIARQQIYFRPFFGLVSLVSIWYILKQLFTSVSVKVVDIYLHFGD